MQPIYKVTLHKNAGDRECARPRVRCASRCAPKVCDVGQVGARLRAWNDLGIVGHARQDGQHAERRRRQVNRARARLPVDDASLGLVKVDMRPPPSTHGEVELLRVRDQFPQTVTQLTETQKPWRSGFWAGRAVVSDGLRPSIRRAWSPDRKRRAPFKLARPTKRGRKPCPLWDFDPNREIPLVNVKRSASP